MVTGSTATAFGDFLIASIKTPYLNLKKVLSWEVLAGVTDISTAGTVSFVSGSAVVTGVGTDFNRLFLTFLPRPVQHLLIFQEAELLSIDLPILIINSNIHSDFQQMVVKSLVNFRH